MGTASIDSAKGPPSPVQALLGAISAGIISLILYKFATIIEAGLSRQTISDDFSVCLIFSCPFLCFCSFSYTACYLESDKPVFCD
jgi:hypothetical protein